MNALHLRRRNYAPLAKGCGCLGLALLVLGAVIAGILIKEGGDAGVAGLGIAIWAASLGIPMLIAGGVLALLARRVDRGRRHSNPELSPSEEWDTAWFDIVPAGYNRDDYRRLRAEWLARVDRGTGLSAADFITRRLSQARRGHGQPTGAA